jgi:hypothetical protein
LLYFKKERIFRRTKKREKKKTEVNKTEKEDKLIRTETSNRERTLRQKRNGDRINESLNILTNGQTPLTDLAVGVEKLERNESSMFHLSIANESSYLSFSPKPTMVGVARLDASLAMMSTPP